MPLFTVAVPTYNRAHFLPETLSCLMRQTYQDFDIIISDNCSTDNTPEIVQRFQDKRIRYVRQDSNVGASLNFLHCAKLARTDWIVFNQDDDLLCPLFLERCARAIQQHPDIVMYATDLLVSTDVTRLKGSMFAGYPLKHHWDQPQPRLFPGEQVAALHWLQTGFLPPAQAFLTHLLIKHLPIGQDELLGDTLLIAGVASEGSVAYESLVGGILRHHPQRLCVLLNDQFRADRGRLCAALFALFANKGIDWKVPLQAILPELPLEFREATLTLHLNDDFLPMEVFAILAESIASERNISSMELIAQLKARRLDAARGGRLERLKLPSIMVRGLRKVFSALGKKY